MSDKANWKTPVGFRDYLPESQAVWRFVRATLENRADGFSFGRITTPLFEEQRVFETQLGDQANTHSSYTLEISGEATRSPVRYALPPAGGNGLVRAYLEHAMPTWIQPVKLWYIGLIFVPNPIDASMTQHEQAGFTTFGDNDPSTDAMMIYYLWQILCDLGFINNLIININSIGCIACRNKYHKAITTYYQPHKSSLCETCQKDLASHAFRLLGCSEPPCLELKLAAPPMLDFLCTACREHFRIVLESIDELGIAYDLNPHLFTTVESASQTIFEVIFRAEEQPARQIADGGRVDGLVERFGGRATPAFGFTLQLSEILSLLRESAFAIPDLPRPDVFVIPLGERAKKSAYSLIASLGTEGLSAICQPTKESLKIQLELAEQAGVRFASIVGQREAIDTTVILRDMLEGTQETLLQEELAQVVKNRLARVVSDVKHDDT